MSKYNVDFNNGGSDVDHDKAIRLLDGIRATNDSLDEGNPREQAEKVQLIKKNPPMPGKLNVTLSRARDEAGHNYLVSSTDDPRAKHKLIIRSPVFSIDLGAAIQGNITKTPGAVIPMLLDKSNEAGKRMDETFCNEKDRRIDFNIGMVLMIILGVVMFGGGIWILLTKFFGG